MNPLLTYIFSSIVQFPNEQFYYVDKQHVILKVIEQSKFNSILIRNLFKQKTNILKKNRLGTSRYGCS